MSFWLFGLVVACQQVAPQGDPLQPVSVVPDGSVESVDVPEGSEEVDESEEEVFTISSEELLEAANKAIPDADTEKNADNGESISATVAPQEPASSPTAQAVPPATATASSPTPVSPVAAAAGWGEVIGKKWPVRLVTTVPNATPPRAILGLPDGREVVVNPGSMVPDMGLVVVAIAPNSAELARIAPAGDHATIETVTLRAQY